METVITDALILREIPYKDNDRILTVLTPEYGPITVGAKGVRNICSKNSAAVQLFCYSELELIRSGSRYTLKTAYCKESFFGLRADLVRYALACYISETASFFCKEGNDESDAFRLLLNTLFATNKGDEKPLWQIKAAYELKLCSVCGFMPELNACAYCGRPATDFGTPDDAFSGNLYTFSLSESALVCNNCLTEAAPTQAADYNIPRTPSVCKLSRSALMAARYVTAAPISRFLSFRLAESDAVGFVNFCEQYLLYTAERHFDTLKYYKSLL